MPPLPEVPHLAPASSTGLLDRLHLCSPFTPQNVSKEMHTVRFRLYEELLHQLEAESFESTDGFYFSEKDGAVRAYNGLYDFGDGKRLTGSEALRLIQTAIRRLIPTAPKPPEPEQQDFLVVDEAAVQNFLSNYRLQIRKKVKSLCSWIARFRVPRKMTPEKAQKLLTRRRQRQVNVWWEKRHDQFQQWLFAVNVPNHAEQIHREYVETTERASRPQCFTSIFFPHAVLDAGHSRLFILGTEAEKGFFSVTVEKDDKEDGDVILSFFKNGGQKWDMQHRMRPGQKKEISPEISCTYVSSDSPDRRGSGIRISSISAENTHALAASPNDVQGAIVTWTHDGRSQTES